jgi:hypothetical protein
VWVDGALCFGGSPETRWVRNLMANRSISVHLSSEAEAIILEGTAEALRLYAHDDALQRRLHAALDARGPVRRGRPRAR